MTKICFLSGDIGRSGGTERVTTVIASALAQEGVDVVILSLSNGHSTYFPVHPDVTLYSMRMERHSSNYGDVRIWRRLRDFLRENRIDCVIDVDTVLSYYSIPATWRTRTKVISWEHFHYFINVGGAFQRFRRAAGRRLAVRCAKAVVTLTERDRQQYLEQLRCLTQIVPIPNPLTISHSKKSDLSSKVVLAAGRLVAEKGFDLLIQAWAEIWFKHSSWRLRIVGSGSDEEALKRQAVELGLAAGVEFVPHSSDMESQYRTASIYACSSRFEGFGLVLVEAKSFGLPVVSFDCACGPSDIVRDGIDGLLVPAENVHLLAISLERLMLDEQCRRDYGDRALEDRRFDLDNIVASWRGLLA